MKREGPSMWAWLASRLAHPPDRSPCRSCGRREAGGASQARLRGEGMGAVADLADLCPRCRRESLLTGLSRSRKGTA